MLIPPNTKQASLLPFALCYLNMLIMFGCIIHFCQNSQGGFVMLQT